MGLGPGDVMSGDLYDVLGLPPTASGDDIRRAYLKLAKVHHPDARVGLDAADSAPVDFVKIKEAFEMLSDPVLRGEYDRRPGLRGVHIPVYDPEVMRKRSEAFNRQFINVVEEEVPKSHRVMAWLLRPRAIYLAPLVLGVTYYLTFGGKEPPKE